MNNKKAFSLVELSIVLVIAAALIAALMNGYSKWDKKAQIERQETSLEAVKSAILNYYQLNDRIPCPAPQNVTPDSASFGVAEAACNPTTSCPIGLSCDWANYTVVGDIPIKTLELPISYISDSNGFKYRYVIDYRFAKYINLNDVRKRCGGYGFIRIVDPSNNPVSDEIMFALISHGNTGVGAFNLNTGAVTVTGGGAYATNYNADNVLIYSLPIEQGASLNDIYDDIIVYSTNPNREACPGGVSPCPIWFDASDECTYNSDTSDRVTNWATKGAIVEQNRTLSMGSTSVRPTVETAQASLINGNRFFNFNSAASQYLSGGVTSFNFPVASASQTYTVVFRTNSAAASAFFTMNNNNAGTNFGAPFLGIGLNAAGNVIATIDGDTVTSTGFTYNDNRIHIATVIWNGASPNTMTLFVDGVQRGSAAAVTPWSTVLNLPILVVGGNTNAPWGMFNGSIFEIVAFNQALSNYQRIKVESELASKWAIAY